jgi:Calcineurin-like phosphoesterase
LKIAVIPDVQVKTGHDFTFLKCIGNYLVDKKPDVVVCIGDFADMPSLSSYDIGKKSFEGRRYKADVEATHAAMEELLRPIDNFNQRARANHKERYLPRKLLTLGNHEQRIERAVENDPKLEGVLSIRDLKYEEYGWEVYPFLDVVVINSIAFSHYFTSGPMGRPCTSAQMMLTKKHMSCVAGHQQGLQFATSYRADGHRLTSIIAGSCYEHNEDYMGPQGNHHYRGIIMLNDVTPDGEFDLMPVSLRFLKERYAE